MASTKVQRIMTQPIKARIQIWLFEQKDLRIEGRITISFLGKSILNTSDNLYALLHLLPGLQIVFCRCATPPNH
ncbi:hypothetical protein F2Q68_00033617 [Brassica cretica]|uniref:Uncharacterized protein n=1 Tax=Brassica cretica TaxID=69181 RepID=A0A8S9H1G5_BRACR|nr:hypothetical protein F2Q68_00033617 [Brassica cretica]